jgi:hypothetical protein
MQWMPGAITRKEAESDPIYSAKTGYKVLETFTVPGRPMDAEWVKSVNYAAPRD